MIERELDLTATITKALRQLPEEDLYEVGTVVRIVDNVASVYGLSKALYYELVEFSSGNVGIIMSLDEYFASVVILKSGSSQIREGESVKRTKQNLKIGVSEEMIGRVVDSLGNPCDALGPIRADKFLPIEQPAPSILERASINEPLETGLLAIDSLIPIGKGQRELILGDRTTGKTALIIDTFLNQKNKNVICIYVSIGNKQSSTVKVIETLAMHDAMKYCIIVQADAYSSALSQFFAPYTGCTIGEYFSRQGRDVLIAYDDLSNHAIAYRELSLLLRRPPGREAYPGDIFYIHSRLLERACKLSDAAGGGSLTALPVTQTQDGDISAYITTNLISITDGQIVLDANVFNRGTKPAISIGVSVSRVGGAAQTKAIKKVSAALKLNLAKYEELVMFAQFGSELDKQSRQSLERGARAMELLKQDLHQLYSTTDQTLFLLLLREGILDLIGVQTTKDFAQQYASFVKHVHPEIYLKLDTDRNLDATTTSKLLEIAHEFMLVFSKNTEENKNT